MVLFALLSHTSLSEGIFLSSKLNAKRLKNLRANRGTTKPKETIVKYSASTSQSGEGSLIYNKYADNAETITVANKHKNKTTVLKSAFCGINSLYENCCFEKSAF